MRLWQKCLLAGLAAVLLVLTVACWGSVGSGICVYCLIMMGAGLMYQKYLTNRDEDDFDME